MFIALPESLEKKKKKNLRSEQRLGDFMIQTPLPISVFIEDFSVSILFRMKLASHYS